MIALIKIYQRTLSPFFGPTCRFSPSCSEYAIAALQKHGPLKGAWLTIWRISRCNPWNSGGHDQIP